MINVLKIKCIYGENVSTRVQIVSGFTDKKQLVTGKVEKLVTGIVEQYVIDKVGYLVTDKVELM